MKSISVLIVTFVFIAGWSLSSAGAADMDGDSRSDIAVYRPASGLWAVQGYTRIYFGSSGDDPAPGDYDGNGIDESAVFRSSSGLWAVRDMTRVYYGGAADIRLPGGGGPKRYDYVVRENDGGDLLRALESDAYISVFVPGGTYDVSQTINVDHVTRITGEFNFTTINFTNSAACLSIEKGNCLVERIRCQGGGSGGASFLINGADRVTLRDCRALDSAGDAFKFDSESDYLSFINCLSRNPGGGDGFRGDLDAKGTRLLDCTAIGGWGWGFLYCRNLTGCITDGLGDSNGGFFECENLAGCFAYNSGSGCGFSSCDMVSACRAREHGGGFPANNDISASTAMHCTVSYFLNCTNICSESTKEDYP